MAEPEILRGWKEIEEYLRMTRKSILRAGYPVHHEGTSRRNVYAIRRELLEYAQRPASHSELPEFP